MNPRVVAAQVVDDVKQGRSLNDSIDVRLAGVHNARDRAWIKAMAYGVCRFYSRLDVVLNQLLQKPIKSKDSLVHALLLIGLYQLMETSIPPHAAVSETVNAVDAINKSWAKGLVNAVLREYLRHPVVVDTDLSAQYAHPVWWIEKIKKAWPEQWPQILEANNTHPPFSLRVNSQRMTREFYLEKLNVQRLPTKIIPDTDHGIILESLISVETLPGFAEGDVSVQDGAAQLAAPLLLMSGPSHLRLLDACAAPGGKLTHLLALNPQASCTAVEKDPQRMMTIQENLSRLQLQATCICCDVNETAQWWDGQLFDRILLDAPCSGSGVIRRHPDIKLLRRETDIMALAKTQRHLLESLWPLLASNGVLLYATCSIFPEEGIEVMQDFLASHDEAKEEKIEASWGIACDIGRQILSGQHNMDGFYYARVRKGD